MPAKREAVSEILRRPRPVERTFATTVRCAKHLLDATRLPGATRLPSAIGRLCMIGFLAAMIGVPGEINGFPSAINRGFADETGVTVGITGHYRIGCWTAVRVPPPADPSGGARDVTLATLDGDGTRTVYRQTLADAAETHAYCVPGGEAVPLVIDVASAIDVGSAIDVASTETLRTRFPEFSSPASGPSLVPDEMPWVVSFGDPMGVETVGANELLDRDPQVAVSVPDAPDQLPDSAAGYDGVDLMIIHGGGRDLLAGMDSRRATAVVDWVRGGGRLMLCLGESAPDLLDAAPWLETLIPLQRSEVEVADLDPSGMETYMSSQTQLPSLIGVRLPAAGRVLISGRTTRRELVPLAIETVEGLGRVTIIAGDLHRPPIRQWPEHLELIIRLSAGALRPHDDDAQRVNRSTAYDDLAGQARVALDRFDTKRPFSFALVTLVVLAFIAIVGPLDYWLVNRVWGRPGFGWITFPTVTIATAAFLTYQARPATSVGDNGASAMEINRLEIVDLDSVRGRGRGFAWSYFYSHPARRFDVAVRPSEGLKAIAGRIDRMMTAPFGWPGPAFGGIQLAGEDARMPPYEVVIEDEGTGASATKFASIEKLPLAPRGSKSLATNFSFDVEREADGEGLLEEVVVSRRRGSELLAGGLTNPLPVDLLDGVLIYRDWAYLLPTRFPAGGRIESLQNLRQKNFRWHLTRQKAIEESTVSQAWDPSAVDELPRIAEMMMFHQAAGGTRYTTLRHIPLRGLDLSSLRSEDRCILVGRLSRPLTQIETGRDTTNRAEEVSIIRLLLPVALPDRSTTD